MQLKRLYDEADAKRYKVERQAARNNWIQKLDQLGVPDDLVEGIAKQIADRIVPQPAVVGYEIEHTGASDRQNFSTSLVTELVNKGLMKIEGDTLVWYTLPEALGYTILRRPGTYCLFCEEKLDGSNGGELARLHVALEHPGLASPDPSNPAGYEVLHAFECELDLDQHDRFNWAARQAAKES